MFLICAITQLIILISAEIILRFFTAKYMCRRRVCPILLSFRVSIITTFMKLLNYICLKLPSGNCVVVKIYYSRQKLKTEAYKPYRPCNELSWLLLTDGKNTTEALGCPRGQCFTAIIFTIIMKMKFLKETISLLWELQCAVRRNV